MLVGVDGDGWVEVGVGDVWVGHVGGKEGDVWLGTGVGRRRVGGIGVGGESVGKEVVYYN